MRVSTLRRCVMSVLKCDRFSRCGQVGAETYEKRLEPDEAFENRDSVSKSLYNAVFNWVVSRVNQALFTGTFLRILHF